MPKFSVSDRMQLAEDLRDSVAAETGELPLTEARVAELHRRLATSSVTRMPERAGRSFVCASSGAFTRPAEACASSSARRPRRTSPKPPAGANSAPWTRL